MAPDAKRLSDLCLMVTTTCTVPLRPAEQEYVLEHESTLRVFDDDDPDEGRPIALLRWARVALGAAMDGGESLFDVFDAKSADLCAVYEALFDADGNLKTPFDEEMFDDVLYFEHFEFIDKAFDEQEASEELTEHVLRLYGGQGIATFIRSHHDSLRFVAGLRGRGFRVIEHGEKTPLYAVSLCRKRPALQDD